MTAKSPKLTDWSSEKPPMVGEYIASIGRNPEMRRWWNGERWSFAYYKNASEEHKRSLRRTLAELDTRVEWRGLVEQPEYPFPPGKLGKL